VLNCANKFGTQLGRKEKRATPSVKTTWEIFHQKGTGNNVTNGRPLSYVRGNVQFVAIRLKCNFQFKMINRYGALWWCTYELGSTYMCSSCYYTVEKQSRRSCEAERLHSGVHEQSRLFINSKSLFFPDHPTHPS